MKKILMSESRINKAITYLLAGSLAASLSILAIAGFGIAKMLLAE